MNAKGWPASVLLMLLLAAAGGREGASFRAEAAAPGPAAPGTIAAGVFTKAQADRGMRAYISRCSACHGELFNGSESGPTLDQDFLDRWKGKSLGDVFTKMRTTMPPLPDKKLGDQDYVDIIAQILRNGGMPAGDAELPVDPQALGAIRIE